MEQFRENNNGRYNGRDKDGSIIMEQYISLNIIFLVYTIDEDRG